MSRWRSFKDPLSPICICYIVLELNKSHGKFFCKDTRVWSQNWSEIVTEHQIFICKFRRNCGNLLIKLLETLGFINGFMYFSATLQLFLWLFSCCSCASLTTCDLQPSRGQQGNTAGYLERRKGSSIMNNIDERQRNRSGEFCRSLLQKNQTELWLFLNCIYSEKPCNTVQHIGNTCKWL